MTTLIWFTLWCILLAICWPLAIVALVLAPLVWLLSLPFLLLGAAVGGTLALVAMLCWLPFKLLAWLLASPQPRQARS
jgi:hypothetical protein